MSEIACLLFESYVLNSCYHLVVHGDCINLRYVVYIYRTNSLQGAYFGLKMLLKSAWTVIGIIKEASCISS